MANILSIDQDYDIVTRYGQAFRRFFIFHKWEEDYPQHKLYCANNENAKRSEIDNILKSEDINFITAMGHGLYTSFTGQNGQVIWQTSDDLSDLKGKIVHLLSCQTGALLGRQMVEAGVKSFWGYTVNFTFYHQNPVPKRLVDDRIAAIFFKMDAIIVRGILANKTSHEIHDSIDSYVAQVYPRLENSMHRSILIDNYVHLVSPATTWGSPDFTLL